MPHQSGAPFVGERVFQNWGVCGQVFPSFSSPTLLLPPFCSHPIFRAARMRKLLRNSFAWPEFRSSFSFFPFFFKVIFLKTTELLGCFFFSQRLRPLALKLFCTQSSHSKIGKAEYWSDDKLSNILNYFTLDHQRLYFSNSSQNSGVVCLSHPPVLAHLWVLMSSHPTPPCSNVPTSTHPWVPTSQGPMSQVPRTHPTFSHSLLILVCFYIDLVYMVYGRLMKSSWEMLGIGLVFLLER